MLTGFVNLAPESEKIGEPEVRFARAVILREGPAIFLLGLRDVTTFGQKLSEIDAKRSGVWVESYRFVELGNRFVRHPGEVEKHTVIAVELSVVWFGIDSFLEMVRGFEISASSA